MPQEDTKAKLAMLNGEQQYWKMKNGIKPMNFQVEQPSGIQINTTPDYLQDMQSKKGK